MEVLKARRAPLKGTLTRLKKFADEITDSVDLATIETRLVRLDDTMKTFTELNDQFYSYVKDPEYVDPEQEYSDFETKYLAIKSKLVKVVQERKTNLSMPSFDPNESVLANETLNRYFDQQASFLQQLSSTRGGELGSVETRLPQIKIPMFSGDYKEWKTFFDLFRSSIDKSTTLTSTQKFYYLKGYLQNDAASLVRHLPVTDENYSVAKEKLIKRYDKKSHIIQSYIQSVFKCSSVSHASLVPLRKLCDTTDEVVRALDSLGTYASSRDPWLLFVLTNKLDPDTKQRWAEDIVGNDSPSIDNFIEFLNKRCEALESCNVSTSRPSSQTSTAVKSLYTQSSPSLPSCPKCKGSHYINNCESFFKMDITSRRKFVFDKGLCFNCLHSGHSSSNCKNSKRCVKCRNRHHTLVHLDNNSSTHLIPNPQAHSSVAIPFTSSQQSSNQPSSPSDEVIYNHHSHTHQQSVHKLLPTALVQILDSSGNWKDCRLLLDTGSQASFISEDCVSRLKLSRSKGRISVSGVGMSGAGSTRGIVSLQLHSRFGNDSLAIDAFILNQITMPMPSCEFNPVNWSYLNGLELADPNYNQPQPVDIILDVHNTFACMREQKVIGPTHHPLAISTLFGWVISGNLPSNPVRSTSAVVSMLSELNIDEALKKFWEIEEVSNSMGPSLSEEEQLAENHFVQNFSRSKDGRFVVRLPFKPNSQPLGESVSIAKFRLRAMHNRFERDKNLKEKYSDFMEEYIALGHMEEIPKDEIATGQCYYIPHHCVFKKDSSNNIRVVFDGSCKTSSGVSLNQTLLVGPPLLQEIFSVCTRFRRFRYVFTADIEKMFRQIWLDPSDCNFQRILWSKSKEEEPKHYRLKTVTYGLASSPFHANRVLRQISFDNSTTSNSCVNDVILNDFYVDDVMTGSQSIAELIRLKDDLIAVLDIAGFPLRKFSSNCWPLLQSLPSQLRQSIPIDFTDDTRIKILGLQWQPSTDVFSFKVHIDGEANCTKRCLLSESARIYDPLGFVTPSIVMVKALFQNLWLEKLGWDDHMPNTYANRWISIRSELSQLEQIRIPRYIGHSASSTSFHGFADASEIAYAAVVYCRAVDASGNVSTTLLAAKSKVAPLKQISIPRLELCGCLLLCRLVNSLSTYIEIPIDQITLWTDSTIVLSWLTTHPRQWKTFVSNRISEIHDLVPNARWKHVSSRDNPADCASRGMLPSALIEHALWWNGPQWLRLDETCWPSTRSSHNSLTSVDNELRPTLNFAAISSNPPLSEILLQLKERTSNWLKIVRILATCLIFISNCRNKSKDKLPLQCQNLLDAKFTIFKWIQNAHFAIEFKCLLKGASIPPSSKLKLLYPLVDQSGLIRVGGRIGNSNLTFNSQHPIILPLDQTIIPMLVKYYHYKNQHAGIGELLSILREEFWIIGARSICKKVVHNCIRCFRLRPKISSQLMGSLPGCRVRSSRPFSHTGVDYAGPLTLRLFQGRNPRYTKGYIALFVCMSTKAVHIELVTDMTTDTFLAALRRFISRRGKPAKMHSDNGTTFKGAEGVLADFHSKFLLQVKNPKIVDSLSQDNIEWQFIPPGAPNFGGLWESNVKCVKSHLKRVIGNHVLTFEQMYTLLTQIEALLNSRPLCQYYDSDTDLYNYLTPAHFLIGSTFTSIAEPDCSEEKQSLAKRWQLVQNMMQGFWARWHKDYVTSLQQRPKNAIAKPNLKEGQLVILKEDNIPPSRWAMAKIVSCSPGPDNAVRVVTVKAKNSIYTRPISKIAVLPLEDC